ncbi:Trp biosynthesis-associated membrane protein [Nonomuraea sp. LPB2021202275-12-8]|uniref:Trp biosynthesis-associated membrane protein n=1 Tax=Nonomuraea sp. LPB2021202275-12-8 TaxID=3120159 RepID=UPI00300CF970
MDPEGGTAVGAAVGTARRRELWTWLAVTAAGCLLVLLAAGRAWAANVREAGASTGLAEVIPPTGGDLSPVLTPLALAGLAGVVAVLATGGAGRRVIGALLALCGLAAALGTWSATGQAGVRTWLREHNVLGTAVLTWDSVVLWPVVAGLGAALMLAGGVAVVVRGGRWAGMSDRYERTPGQARPEAADDRALWDALDRGDDPTESR